MHGEIPKGCGIVTDNPTFYTRKLRQKELLGQEYGEIIVTYVPVMWCITNGDMKRIQLVINDLSTLSAHDRRNIAKVLKAHQLPVPKIITDSFNEQA